MLLTKKLPVSESGTPALHTTPRDKKLGFSSCCIIPEAARLVNCSSVYQAEMPEVVQLRQFDQLPYWQD
jgi:hypothetical protein